MSNSKIDPDELLKRYIEKYGRKNVAKVWSILAKDEKFVQALDSTVGQELYQDLLERMGTSKTEYDSQVANCKDVGKVSMEIARPLIKYQAYAELLRDWNERIRRYRELKVE